MTHFNTICQTNDFRIIVMNFKSIYILLLNCTSDSHLSKWRNGKKDLIVCFNGIAFVFFAAEEWTKRSIQKEKESYGKRDRFFMYKKKMCNESINRVFEPIIAHNDSCIVWRKGKRAKNINVNRQRKGLKGGGTHTRSQKNSKSYRLVMYLVPILPSWNLQMVRFMQ